MFWRKGLSPRAQQKEPFLNENTGTFKRKMETREQTVIYGIEDSIPGCEVRVGIVRISLDIRRKYIGSDETISSQGPALE
jgi:hypothetical protein